MTEIRKYGNTKIRKYGNSKSKKRIVHVLQCAVRMYVYCTISCCCLGYENRYGDPVYHINEISKIFYFRKNCASDGKRK